MKASLRGQACRFAGVAAFAGVAFFVVGCGGTATRPAIAPRTEPLVQARSGVPALAKASSMPRSAVDPPPPDLFQTVRYPNSLGAMDAYLTVDPKDGKKRPAILWITGGDCNSIGDVWSEAPADNDQSASAYRKAGIVMMFPSLRGGNRNPGQREGFWGEVDDVLEARMFLAQQPFVDHTRIYLGGHSTGGTLALLVSECSDQFRAVFSFGPVDDVRGYPEEYTPFDTSHRKAGELRSPIYWLHSIKKPTFVFEGQQGNIDSLRAMSQQSTNDKVRFFPVPGDHFNILGPVNRLIAKKILEDSGPTCNIAFTAEELAAARR